MFVRHNRGLAVGGPEWYGGRGLFAAGDVSGVQQTYIDYITIATTGNATNFGNLNHSRGKRGMSGCSDGSRGLFAGGGPYASQQGDLTIDYVTIATTGNATDFGDMTVPRDRFCAGACSDGDKGLFAGGLDRSGWNGSGQGTSTWLSLEVIDYVTIATTGNATDFGNLLDGRSQGPAAVCDGTLGLFAGGYNSSFGSYYTNQIDYVTVATPGNATDFGDLVNEISRLSATGDDTRGLIAGGAGTFPYSEYITAIDYVTIATPGNATSFGDLTTTGGSSGGTGNDACGSIDLGSCSDLSRACFGGSHGQSWNTAGNGNHVDYVTIATTGNATDFGSLTHTTNQGGHGSCSG